MKTKLGLKPEIIEQARGYAKQIAKPVQSFIEKHTTVTVERATLRLMGIDGVDQNNVPLANKIVDLLGDNIKRGAARYYVNALIKTGKTIPELNGEIAAGLNIASLDMSDEAMIKVKSTELVRNYDKHMQHITNYRRAKLEQFKANEKSPLIYVIVATGNIYEDFKQAQSAVLQGADVIAVIRTTAQSLLDYVPYGATTEGFGGTYATQENFKIMRAALDETGEKVQRYIRLVNYASGLCMPEIAAMGSLERLDMMLNDSMYGILFRDINMYRTFVDQNFSRMINARAEIVINTGEDNYLTTSDAFEKANTVLASQLINERFALNAGMPYNLMGLGHAFEMDPQIKNGFLYELAQAQMAREIFPDCPLKYMPPTKFMTGDIFKGYAMNTMFNFVSKATNQGIQLLGMLTEAIHTPYLQDRYLAIENAKYVANTMESFYDEIEFKENGLIKNRAKQVLDETVQFLEQVNKAGLFDAIETGMFADVKRPKNGGKGINGVFEKAPDYSNPFEDYLKAYLKI